MGIETAGFSLMAGCMVEVHPIQNSISGKLNRKVEVIMVIRIVPFMQTVLNWPIIKIPIIGGSIQVNCPLADGRTLVKPRIVRSLSFLSFRGYWLIRIVSLLKAISVTSGELICLPTIRGRRRSLLLETRWLAVQQRSA